MSRLVDFRNVSWRPIVVAAVALLLFSQTAGFGFVNFDDFSHIWGNRHSHAPDPTAADFWIWSAYPITVPTITWAANYTIHGLDPTGYHVVNVLLHAVVSLLAFRLLRRLGLSPTASLVAALVFVVHPIVSEPVSWVSGRKYLLASLFSLAATDLWCSDEAARRAWRDVAANAFFLLGLLSSPTALALPVFVVWHRGFSRRTILAVAPAFLMVVALLLLASTPVSFSAVSAERGAEFPLRFFRTVGFKLLLLVSPFSYSHIYLVPKASWGELATIVGILATAGLILLVVVRRFRESIPVRLVVFAAAAFAPVSNLVPLSHEIGDSHLYLPLVPIAGLVGIGVERVSRFSSSAVIRVAVLSAIPLALAPVAIAESQAWRDSASLWSRAARQFPESPDLCEHVGAALTIARRFDEAESRFVSCARRFGDATKLSTIVAEQRPEDRGNLLRGFVGRFEALPDTPIGFILTTSRRDK